MNIEQEDVRGKVVLIGREFLKNPDADRRFKVETDAAGFGATGASLSIDGGKVFGTWLADDTKGWVYRRFIEEVLS